MLFLSTTFFLFHSHTIGLDHSTLGSSILFYISISSFFVFLFFCPHYSSSLWSNCSALRNARPCLNRFSACAAFTNNIRTVHRNSGQFLLVLQFANALINLSLEFVVEVERRLFEGGQGTQL
jgi:hypothetical protein